jgi:glutamine synthetase
MSLVARALSRQVIGGLAKRGAPALASGRSRSFMSSIDDYGTHLFTGAIADKYLATQGLPAGLLDDPTWTTSGSADGVAAAIMDWAGDKGASVYTHWFQPLGSSGVRTGLTGQVHNAFFSFGKDGKPKFEFKGKELLKGETDGSSYQNGGMRATHTAGGYTVLDPTSPVFLRGDTVYVPTVFVSFYGDALDEKTPLLRSMEALNRETVRLCKNMGYSISGAQPNIGLEQEYFLVPRSAYYKRLDLQMTGRTIMGKLAPRGQEMCDHYMAPPNQIALECIKEIQHECFMLGIPMRTRHREVAPNQYECAPLFGLATTQIDQNLLFCQIGEEVSARHGLAFLEQEKPFAGINGSGKHNNFSIGTTEGVNLLNCEQVTKESGSPEVFATIMSAIVKSVDVHGDLMRMSIASPGNDFRLGACEAPPAIVSTYLGDSLTSYLEAFKDTGSLDKYVPQEKEVNLGVPSIAPFTVPAEDRNRTSPFPYGGHRFEFRAVGSAQNVSMVNTVLCTIFAEAFAEFSTKIEGGAKPTDVAAAALKEHWRVIFNGDGYSEEWPIEAGKRGIWRIDSGVESMARLSADKNVALFDKMGVMSKKECDARTTVMFDHYAGTVEMEALSMIDMINQHIIPSCVSAKLPTAELEAGVKSVQTGLESMHGSADEEAKATAARVLRLETMEAVRAVCDKAEEMVPAELWTIATYKDLLFLDANQGAEIIDYE